MLREVVDVLNIKARGVYVDATVGLGGHSEEILRQTGPDGMLIGIDRDEEALKTAERKLSWKGVFLKKGRFSDLSDLLAEAGVKEIDGILFDFGVSMMQFRDMGRGFSFYSEDPLDMRMDRSQRLKAEDIVNNYSEPELEKVLREYGEERFSARIAKAIVLHRKRKRIATCAELSGIVSRVYKGRGRLHPATKTFQALRIEVNNEINEIRAGLSASIGVLRRGGRICTISYHSLEDRAVKQFMKAAEKEGLIRVITKKPMIPSYSETRANPSSRSAKLRGAERL